MSSARAGVQLCFLVLGCDDDNNNNNNNNVELIYCVCPLAAPSFSFSHALHAFRLVPNKQGMHNPMAAWPSPALNSFLLRAGQVAAAFRFWSGAIGRLLHFGVRVWGGVHAGSPWLESYELRRCAQIRTEPPSHTSLFLRPLLLFPSSKI